MKKLNVGIIGYGWVATAHITAINSSDYAQVTAIYSSRPQDDAALSSRWDWISNHIQTWAKC